MPSDIDAEFEGLLLESFFGIKQLQHVEKLRAICYFTFARSVLRDVLQRMFVEIGQYAVKGGMEWCNIYNKLLENKFSKMFTSFRSL